jgi:ankyrin repeat protein
MIPQLFGTIKAEDFNKVKELIEKCEDVNAEYNGRTILIFICCLVASSPDAMTAYEDENLKIIKLLIDKGANVNTEDNNGKTALLWTLQNGYFKSAKLLIDNNADVNIRDTTLMEAYKNNHYNLLELIVDDVNIEKVNCKTAESPLMKACRGCNFYDCKTEAMIHFDDPEIFKLLIDKGADVNTKDEFGNTALMQVNNPEIAKLLIDKGADVNAKNKYGTTPLMRVSNLETAKLLIDNGANVNAKDNEGETPLMVATEFDEYEIVKFLIENGADINAKNNKGKSVLMYAKTNEMKDLLNS